MGIRSSAAGRAFGEYQRTANAGLDRFLEDIEVEVSEAMTDAAIEAQHYIATRGVRNTVPNYEGRIKTGAMIDAVDHRVERHGDVIRGTFGWLPGSPRPKYFGWQESGTLEHGQPAGDPDPRSKQFDEKSGQPVSRPRGIRPMMALFDAGNHARLRLDETLPRLYGKKRA